MLGFLARFYKKNSGKILFFFGFFVILVINSLAINYPDEFDNILGGKLLLHGIIPYRGFFAHHAPLGYFLSAPLVLIGGISFVHFRILTAIFFLGLFYLENRLLVKQVPKLNSNYFLGFLALLAVAMPYFWGQLFLADVLAGYFLILPYSLLLLKTYFTEKLETADVWIISLFSAAALLTSATYLYAVAILVTVTIWQSRKWKNILIFGLPYFIFIIYLLVTGSFSDFRFQAITYNQQYYIYNYPRPAGSSSFNPIRYAVILFNYFYNNFDRAVVGIPTANWGFPMTHLLALANVVLLFFLTIRKKFLAGFLVFGALVYVTARGDPAEIKPTDYQTGVYFILSLLNIFLVLFLIDNNLEEIKNKILRPTTIFLGSALILASILGSMFLFSEWWRSTYNRYMGIYPLIYDRPVVAQTVNAIVPADHYCWVGPFEFEEMFYLRCRLPSKYNWILPQFKEIPAIQQEIIADYSRKMPDVIVYRRNFSAFNQSAEFSNFFIDFLNQKYYRLRDLGKYHFVNGRVKDSNFDDDFNLERAQAPALLQKLLEKGYVVKD